jgi:hypothetical protein
MGYKSVKEGQNTKATRYRDLLAWTLGILTLNGPGLFWLYIVVDALQQVPSTAYWLGTTPNGEMSVFAEYVGAIVLFVVWTSLVLALFVGPMRESLSDA